MQNIGIKFKEAMRKLGLTRSDLSNKTNLSIDTITNIIYGRSKKYEHVVMIAKILNIDIEAINLHSHNNIYDGPKLDFTKYNHILVQLDKALHKRSIFLPKKILILWLKPPIILL